MKYHYFTANVFSEKIFGGAQIAVFPEAEGLTETQMQLIAREFSLSETVFLFSPDKAENACRVRIFSPLKEVDFGSHTIMATAFILAQTHKVSLNGKHTPLVLELNAGEVNAYVTKNGHNTTMLQFSRSVKPSIDNYVPETAEIAKMLSLKETDLATHKYKILLSSAENIYLVVPVKSLAAVRAAAFDYKAWSMSMAPSTLANNILLFSTQTSNGASDFHARLLGPDIGVHEDPPIGAAIPAFVAYLCAHEHISKGTHAFTTERGDSSVRQSLLNIEMDNAGSENIQMRVGGPAVLVSSGQMEVPA